MRLVAGAVVLAMLGGCAQIRSTSTVKVLPKAGATPLQIGGPSGHITARGAELLWEQRASSLEVQLVETRACRELRHLPVVRSEHVVRKAGGAIYWEYGIAAASLAFGLVALIRPQLLSPDAINQDGEVVKDKRTGYRVGAVFTVVGAAFLGAGIFDSVRARDQTYHADAYQLEFGERIECAEPRVPIPGTSVEVVVGEWRTTGTTNSKGHVTFALPSQLDIAPPEPEADPEPAPPPASEGRGMPEVSAVPATNSHDLRNGVIRLDAKRAAAFDFAVPFSSPAAGTHKGKATMRPGKK